MAQSQDTSSNVVPLAGAGVLRIQCAGVYSKMREVDGVRSVELAFGGVDCSTI